MVAVAGTSFQADATIAAKRLPLLQKQPVLRRPDLGRSVRRGSKADGTKVRGIDIRMAAAAALSCQQDEDAAAEQAAAVAPSPPTDTERRCSPAAAAQENNAKGGSTPVGGPAASRGSPDGGRRLRMSAFRDAEGPFQDSGLGGRAAPCALYPLAGSKSSPLPGALPPPEFSRSSSAGISLYGRTTLVRCQPVPLPQRVRQGKSTMRARFGCSKT